MLPRIYLDHNATTPLVPAARAAMIDAMDCLGNPSSVHREGRVARALIDDARSEVAALTGSDPADVIFTSGATEALNMALTPALADEHGSADVLLVSAGEHAAVMVGHRFAPDRVRIVPLTADGVVDLAALGTVLDGLRGHRIMLALQAANNETGVVQPVAAAAAVVRRHGGFVVCDAVQAAGKIDCDLATFGADAIAISAHKFGGPNGVGALIFARGQHHLRQGVVRGGGQESGLRSGTENLVGIVGFGAAACVARTQWVSLGMRLRPMRDALAALVVTQVPGTQVFGAAVGRLPNTVSFAAPGFSASVLAMNLDLAGIAVSAGSACSSGKATSSRLLSAMGVAPALGAVALRVSFGWTTQDGDIDAFTAAYERAIEMMRPRAGQLAA